MPMLPWKFSQFPLIPELISNLFADMLNVERNLNRSTEGSINGIKDY
jgi:hypothetical protein